MRLSGRAVNNNDIDDVNNLKLTFPTELFNDGLTAQSNGNATIDFEDNINAYVINGFKESVDDNNAIANYAIVRINSGLVPPTGGTYNPNDFRITGLLDSYNFPTPPLTFTRANETDLKIEFNQNIPANIVTNKNNSGYITIDFQNGTMFKSGSTPNFVKIPLEYVEKPNITLSAQTLNENNLNDGSVDGKLTFTINNNDKIIGDVTSLSRATNLPHELKAQFRQLNDSQIEMSLDNEAALHKVADSLDDVSVDFDGGLFESGVAP